jgi:hypothetical protein
MSHDPLGSRPEGKTNYDKEPDYSLFVPGDAIILPAPRKIE